MVLPAQIVDKLNFVQAVPCSYGILAGFLGMRPLSVAYIDLFVHVVRTSGETSHL